jgi:hypothetical protein
VAANVCEFFQQKKGPKLGPDFFYFMLVVRC